MEKPGRALWDRLDRQTKFRVIDARKKQGWSQTRIAKEWGVAHQTISHLLNDPDLSKQKKRRLGYGGKCVDCGAPTYGSSLSTASVRCAKCQIIHLKSSRYWTRERVIKAIQAWADEHGEPPGARDFVNGNIAKGYPSYSGIYGQKHAPFKSWADAVEAAGFPRPQSGKYDRAAAKRKRLGTKPGWDALKGETPRDRKWKKT